MLNKINQLFDRVFFTPKPLPPGKYNSQRQIGDVHCRLHLRIGNDGTGILIVNAATVLHLNQTAAEIAYHLINNHPIDEIAAELAKRYQVRREVALQDINDIETRLETLVKTPDLDPETFLDMERVARHGQDTEIPLRLDCAITYQIPSGEANLFTPAQRVDRTLDTEEWKEIIKQAWEWGIPHAVFTGGEPTLRPDLKELLQAGEELGMVTGLITDGNRLTNTEYFHGLLDAGLDHLMILLNNKEETSWEAIRDVLNEDIHLTVHITLTANHTNDFPVILDRLVNMGVENISLSSPSKDFEGQLTAMGQLTVEKGLSLVYDLPVPYSEFNPVNLELEESEANDKGAARSWIYIEPDGDVLPGQGYPTKLGNLLSDGWMNVSANRKIYLAN
jgi:organic radical activating enzyme